MLAGLRCVDWVVPFAESTPAALIGRILPDVLVKGDDYKIADIAGSDAVMAAGGSVRTLAFRPGCSSSSMLQRIMASEVESI